MSLRGKLVAAVVLMSAATANAQTVWAGAAVQADIQRFPQDIVPNRLDGFAGGWTALVGAIPVRRVAARVEATRDTILDSRTVSLTLDGRSVTIQSTLSHRTSIVSALGGFTHTLGTRTRIAYVAGPAWIKVERTFTTDAAGFVLTSPSDLGAPVTSTTVDRSFTLAVGADALVRMWRHISVFAGVRAHPIPLEPDDTSGWSTRMMAGGAWVF